MTADQCELLSPLARFCEARGESLPIVRVVPDNDVPAPYRDLLVHDGDMTSKLESFHRERTVLRVLHRTLDGDSLAREVVLVGERSGRPVEYGAIEIDLAAFEPGPRAEIERGRRPLGGILNEFSLPFVSRPQAFLEIVPGPSVVGALEIGGRPPALFARCNTLSSPGNGVFARIVEILPPAL